jgi:hypothetical protein
MEVSKLCRAHYDGVGSSRLVAFVVVFVRCSVVASLLTTLLFFPRLGQGYYCTAVLVLGIGAGANVGSDTGCLSGVSSKLGAVQVIDQNNPIDFGAAM